MCLDPDAFAYFISMLDSSIVETLVSGALRIWATEGPVDWWWMPIEELWCINGVLK